MNLLLGQVKLALLQTLVVGGLGAVCKCANVCRLKLFFKMCGGKIF
jgi:hypothetical protein